MSSKTWKLVVKRVKSKELYTSDGPTITKSNVPVQVTFFHHNNLVLVKFSNTYDRYHHRMDKFQTEYISNHSSKEFKTLIENNVFIDESSKYANPAKLFSIKLLRELTQSNAIFNSYNNKSMTTIINYYDKRSYENEKKDETENKEEYKCDESSDIWKFQIKHQPIYENPKGGGKRGSIDVSIEDWYAGFRKKVVFSIDANCPQNLKDETISRIIITLNKSGKQLYKTEYVTEFVNEIKKIIPTKAHMMRKFEDKLEKMVKTLNATYHIQFFEKFSSSTMIMVTKVRNEKGFGSIEALGDEHTDDWMMTKATTSSTEDEVKRSQSDISNIGLTDQFRTVYSKESACAFDFGDVTINCISSAKCNGSLWDYKDSMIKIGWSPKAMDVKCTHALIIIFGAIIQVRTDLKNNCINIDLKPGNILFQICNKGLELIRLENYSIYLHLVKPVICDYGQVYESTRLYNTMSKNRGTEGWNDPTKKGVPNHTIPWQLVTIFLCVIVKESDLSCVAEITDEFFDEETSDVYTSIKQKVNFIKRQLDYLNEQNDVMEFIARYFTNAKRPGIRDLLLDNIFYGERQIAQMVLHHFFKINKNNAKTKIDKYKLLKPITNKLQWTNK